MCIGLPPAGKYNMEVNPSTLAFRNQSIKGTLVAGMADVDETMDFARRGMIITLDTRNNESLTLLAGKLRLEPTVVGLSKFNESVQKLKNGQVAGCVTSIACRWRSKLTFFISRIVVDFNKD
jgi:propanol-preferring alcohol dehydrogenase